MATIGLDIGTTGCKATVVDEIGTAVFQEHCEYDLMFPKDGYVELNPITVWNGVKHVLLKVLSAYPEQITSLAVASFGEAAVLLDQKGKPVSNSIFYTDVRGNDCIEELTSKISA